MSSTVQSMKAKVAVAHRSYAPNSPEILDLRRELAAAKIAQYVERIVSSAPPLTLDQRSRLAALLSGGDVA